MLTLSGTFADLRARVADAGLLAPRRSYYFGRITLNLALAAACWTGFALVGDSWWQLLVAVALGLSFVQSGFLGHDAGHRQVGRGRRAVEKEAASTVNERGIPAGLVARL